MTSGADPFSILSKNSFAHQPINTSKGPNSKKAPVVKRYRPGVKPELYKNSDQESDSDDDFDMFSDNKTIISKFTANTKNTQNTNLGLDTLGNNKSRIIKKNLSNSNVSKINKKIQKLTSKIDSKESALVRREAGSSLTDIPVEKKLKVAKNAVTVVSRRSRRGAIKSTENVTGRESTAITEENNDLGARKNRVSTEEAEKMALEAKEAKAEDSSATEEYSDSETGSEEESEEIVNTIKRPVFIRKEDRYMQEKELEDELKTKLEEKRIKQSIKEQNKLIVIESKAVREDVANTDIFGSDTELPNDEDDDPETAYSLWRERELGRLKRDREEREREFLEKERTERRRLMTDEERAKEDKKLGKYKKNEKSNLQFMQKYYHTGIFGDQSDPLFTRDYNIGVGTDNYDKSNLPQALQVRRGWEHKRGRSKYTHLGDQDTTNFDKDWGVHEDLKNKFMGKMGGYKSSNAFDRPSRGKK